MEYRVTLLRLQTLARHAFIETHPHNLALRRHRRRSPACGPEVLRPQAQRESYRSCLTAPPSQGPAPPIGAAAAEHVLDVRHGPSPQSLATATCDSAGPAKPFGRGT